MARASFGGGVADFVVSAAAPGDPLRFAPATLTFWDAETGGTQYTDLLWGGDPVTAIPVSTDGQIPTFQGPDGVVTMWAQAGASGPRAMVDAAGYIATLAQAAADLAADAQAAAEAAAAAAEAVGAIADTQIANQIETPGSATHTTLTATIASEVTTPGTPTNDGLLASTGAQIAEDVPPLIAAQIEDANPAIAAAAAELAQTDAGLARARVDDAPDGVIITALGPDGTTEIDTWMQAGADGLPTEATVWAFANAVHAYTGPDRPFVYPGNFIHWTETDATGEVIDIWELSN